MKQEETFQEISQDAFSYLNISEQDYMMSQQMHASDPSFQELMMGLQLQDDDNYEPKVTKEKAKEIYKYMAEQMTKMTTELGSKQYLYISNQEQFMLEIMVEQAKINDQMYEKYGVEEVDFSKCIQHYDLMNDPDIK
jgi:hypothetical protein